MFVGHQHPERDATHVERAGHRSPVQHPASRPDERPFLFVEDLFEQLDRDQRQVAFLRGQHPRREIQLQQVMVAGLPGRRQRLAILRVTR